jgi:RNA polymerase sigma-70 factor (ECF subfamily)
MRAHAGRATASEPDGDGARGRSPRSFMSERAAARDHGAALLALYDAAVVEVYRYLHYRCRNAALAEELTAETFMAAVESIRRGAVQAVTTGWLVGIARHKLVDHWRRAEREQRNLRAVDEPAVADDPWDAELDGFAARDALEQLGAQQRAALTLRYVDDLPVPEVAEVLGRSVHATESLLARARQAFRAVYEQGGRS